MYSYIYLCVDRVSISDFAMASEKSGTALSEVELLPVDGIIVDECEEKIKNNRLYIKRVCCTFTDMFFICHVLVEKKS